MSSGKRAKGGLVWRIEGDCSIGRMKRNTARLNSNKDLWT